MFGMEIKIHTMITWPKFVALLIDRWYDRCDVVVRVYNEHEHEIVAVIRVYCLNLYVAVVMVAMM